jgi:hypothetical protein
MGLRYTERLFITSSFPLFSIRQIEDKIIQTIKSKVQDGSSDKFIECCLKCADLNRLFSLSCEKKSMIQNDINMMRETIRKSRP